MKDSMVQVFEKELKNKIIQKMVPNQCEDKILAKYFKHYDLDNTGYCKFRDFVKTLEKIGVILGKIIDIQHVFNHYDTEQTGYIDYKKFSFDLFNEKTETKQKTLSTIVIENRNKNGFESNMMKDSHLIKLHNFIKSKGVKGFIKFYKEFKTVDYNNLGRLDIDEFIKVVTETKLPLNSNEVQLLFHQYEKNNNSYFFYEELFKDLKSLYHNRNRGKFVENLYRDLSEVLGRLIKLSDIINSYNPRTHKNYLGNYKSEDLAMDFSELIDAFQNVFKIKKDQSLSRENFVEFFKFFGFGIESDETFYDILTNAFSNNTEVNEGLNSDNKQYKTLDERKNSEDKSERNKNLIEMKYNTNDNTTTNHKEYIKLKKELIPELIMEPVKNTEDPVISKLRKNLQSYGRKSLFSLIKHFKYYDNGTKFINKFDFAKVMKDFRLNLTISEIEKLFILFCNKNEQINYDAFIKTISNQSLNENRIFLIQQIFDRLKRISDTELVELKLMKSIFNPRNHPTKRDENEIYSEYFECIEMFLFAYKNRKNSEISYDDFEEFQRLISFLVYDDETFSNIVNSEWKNILSNKLDEAKSGMDPYYNKEKDLKSKQEHDRSNHRLDNKSIKTFTTPLNQDQEKSTRSKTPIHKRLVVDGEKETALVQNQYNKNKSEKIEDPLLKLKRKLQKRGIRGLMNLHKQFLLNSSNINAISFGDFVKVLKLQRIDLTAGEYQTIFMKFSQAKNSEESCLFLNFSLFIRNFKKILSDVRLEYLEKAFTVLDVDCAEMLNVDDIKLKFEASNHPDVKRNIRTEDEIVVEFLDSFDLNYNFLAANENPNSSNLVSFEEFANFYEYVSFIYDNDEDFVRVVCATWNI